MLAPRIVPLLFLMNLWPHGMGIMIDGRTDCLRFRAAKALVATGALASALAAAGCGGAEQTSAGPKAANAARSERLSHESCGESQGHVESVDANGDGKPDIQRITDHGREVCRTVDLDNDGKPDLYEYFDSAGEIRRREYCYDQTGTVNAIEFYEGGKLVRREYDIGGQQKIDTWDWFDPNAPPDPKTGRPAHPIRRERDTKGTGQVDQWWTWNGDQVTIAFDKSGDGRPDPDTAVVLGADGNPITPPAPGSGTPPAPGLGGASTSPASDAGAAPPPASSGDGGAS
jgi:hypothetical protein